MCVSIKGTVITHNGYKAKEWITQNQPGSASRAEKSPRMDTQDVESRAVGALPLLRQLSGDIGLVEVIDTLVQWDPTRCRLSPGQRIEALVLNILAGRRPLYRVAEFYEDTAMDLVFGPDVAAEHLTDDCLARALDKLADSGPRAVYSAVALRACLLEGIDRTFLHYDTTSISLYGEYADTPPTDLQLVRGFSKALCPYCTSCGV